MTLTHQVAAKSMPSFGPSHRMCELAAAQAVVRASAWHVAEAGADPAEVADTAQTAAVKAGLAGHAAAEVVKAAVMAAVVADAAERTAATYGSAAEVQAAAHAAAQSVCTARTTWRLSRTHVRRACGHRRSLQLVLFCSPCDSVPCVVCLRPTSPSSVPLPPQRQEMSASAAIRAMAQVAALHALEAGQGLDAVEEAAQTAAIDAGCRSPCMAAAVGRAVVVEAELALVAERAVAGGASTAVAQAVAQEAAELAGVGLAQRNAVSLVAAVRATARVVGWQAAKAGATPAEAAQAANARLSQKMARQLEKERATIAKSHFRRIAKLVKGSVRVSNAMKLTTRHVAALWRLANRRTHWVMSCHSSSRAISFL